MQDIEKNTLKSDYVSPDHISISGIDKAAALFNYLGNDAIKPLLSHLNRNEVESIVNRMKKIDSLSKEVIEKVVNDFHQKTSILVSINDPDEIAENVLNEFDEVQIKISPEAQKKAELKYLYALENKPTETIYKIFEKEPVQVWGCVLSILSASKANELIALVEKEKRFNILYFLTRIKNINDKTLHAINNFLSDIMESEDKTEEFNGPKRTADILSLVVENESLEILNTVKSKDKDLYDAISVYYMSFSDLINLDEKILQKILTTLEPKDISQAICQSSKEIIDKCMSVITKRAATLIEDEMKSLSELSIEVVQQAQQKIIAHARKLESNNEIKLIKSQD